MSQESNQQQKSPLREIIQPFIDLAHAPRALWGINLSYLLEGMVYFGMLGYLAMHFSDLIFKGVAHADEWSHSMVMILTGGITISMFFLGTIVDKFGVRKALLSAFIFMLAGRLLISAAPTVLHLEVGLWSSMHLVTIAGMLLVVVGYGMYQPGAYAAVRQFTNPKTASMGFAMLYALMNLGGWLPSFAFLVRDNDYLGFGIPGTFWVYTFITVVALLIVFFVLSRKTVESAILKAKEERAAMGEEDAATSTSEKSESEQPDEKKTVVEDKKTIPWHMWLIYTSILLAYFFKTSGKAQLIGSIIIAVIPLLIVILPHNIKQKIIISIANHPLADLKFSYFIFCLIPVQTLFTYNWLILPQYISRAFDGWIGKYFEIAANANPLLIFIAVPIITALTQKAKVYRMMIIGTTVMAAPAFLLTIGPYPWTLFTYLFIMTIGEAMWQPRFLQYAAEIAPEGKTGVYMGVAQLPWFLTKILVPLLYSGYMMEHYCPAHGPQNTEMMWLIFGFIALASPVLLILANNWLGKNFKTKA